MPPVITNFMTYIKSTIVYDLNNEGHQRRGMKDRKAYCDNHSSSFPNTARYRWLTFCAGVYDISYLWLFDFPDTAFAHQ